MEDINAIYHNPFGIAFQWKRNSTKDIHKVQMVFRNTGLLLTHTELQQFLKNIKCTMESTPLCSDCANNDACRALLIDTPAPQVSLAVNHRELQGIYDLVEGTLFQLNLDNYLGSICKA